MDLSTLLKRISGEFCANNPLKSIDVTGENEVNVECIAVSIILGLATQLMIVACMTMEADICCIAIAIWWGVLLLWVDACPPPELPYDPPYDPGLPPDECEPAVPPDQWPPGLPPPPYDSGFGCPGVT